MHRTPGTFRLSPGLVPLLLCAAVLVPAQSATAQGTLEDYRRAASLEDRYAGLVTNVVEDAWWDEAFEGFVLRRSVEGGIEFLTLDPESGAESPAFDHGAVAGALAELLDESVDPANLPFSRVRFGEDDEGIRVSVGGDPVRCSPTPVRCERAEANGAGGGGPPGGFGGGGGDARPSPDEALHATIEGYNLVVRSTEGDSVVYRTRDGTEGNAYQLGTLRWAPDSERLVIHRVVPGYDRQIHYVESSPAHQLQPVHHTRSYTKPGDVLDRRQPVLIDPHAGTRVEVDDALFPNAYSLSTAQWRNDSREFTLEYNQRGHDRYRVIGVDGETGRTRTIIDENPATFFYYRPSSQNGTYFRHDLDDGREIIWMSERDGWKHLYLYDGETGEVIRQITSGEWVVRDVEFVDEERGEIVFAASGMDPDQDPYFVHYYRIGLDGTGLEPLTEADGHHSIQFSPDRSVYLDTWSRVDLPPVTQLRRTSDGSVLGEPGRGDHSALLEAGWRAPEVFWAPGRDGETPIRGIIQRPSNFSAERDWPVIESIYAGPHDHHVPVGFTVIPPRGMLEVAELGFVTVMIDGMGTAGRSKAFHDVAWKNLGDAGFPDRIRWHEAVAAKHDWYSLDRVGIYGGSAGGQNAMGGLLFHPEFYHVAVAHNGCHDNRMDKIWWNELWMGWPVDETYDASSNVVHAHRLEGRLLLTVGEMDTNVDPASTYQVADALIRAGKEFDFFVVPGGGHARGPEHVRKRWDFLVQHVMGVTPPDWNRVRLAERDSGTGDGS